MQNIVSVGIDVGKATVEVGLLAADQTQQTRSFDNTTVGLRELIRWFQKQGVEKATPCVIESTGDLHLLSAVTLTNAGFTVNVINPIITKQYQRSSIRDAKTDRIDALRLARIGLMEINLRVFSANLQSIGAKKALSLIATLERTKQQLARSAKQFRETQVLLGLPVKCTKLNVVIKGLELQINLLYGQVEQITSVEAKQLAKETPGLSVRQMAVLVTAVSGARFTNRDQLIAYVGLDIKKRESSNWHGREKISKRGNPFVRKVLFQIGWSLKQNNTLYRAYFERLKQKGKHYFTCILAVARKFLRFFFAYYLQNKSPLILSTAI